jgi:hypothetical protein
MGHVSKRGVTYKSLSETDPWNLTLSLLKRKAYKAYAQSKCTVVILRENGIREYLAYVDKGEDYVGLHQSFHLHEPPANYPFRIPISIKSDNVTEISQTDSLLTFSTAQGPVFAYGNLIATDARGNQLESRMLLENQDSDHPTIVVEVLEEGEFPIVIG